VAEWDRRRADSLRLAAPVASPAGFDVCSTTVREPMLPSESDRQTFVLSFVR
jgi:hypothetical protein